MLLLITRTASEWTLGEVGWCNQSLWTSLFCLVGDEGNPSNLLYCSQLCSQFELQPFNPTVDMTWIPVWSGMVLVKAAFCVQKNDVLFWSSGVFMWIASSAYFLEGSRVGLKGACVCGQPVKWDCRSSSRLGFGSPDLERKQKSHLNSCNSVLHLCTFPQLGLSGKVFGLQWVFSMLSLLSFEWKLFTCFVYNFGSSSVLWVFGGSMKMRT